MIRPGEVYWADTEGGQHPIIVVSRETLNRGNTVVAVVLTSAKLTHRVGLPNCVPFRAGEFGFTRDCVALAESVGPVLIAELDMDTGPIGQLTAEALRDVVRAIGIVLEADCEPE